MLETNVETVQNQERFINVRSLLIHSLLRWKVILAAALLACLFGGYREYAREKELIAAGNAREETAEKEGLISDEDYTTVLARIDEQLAERYTYFSHSKFMKLNPYKTFVSYASYYVLSPNEGTADYDAEVPAFTDEDRNAVMLMTALQDYVNYGISWEDETEKYGLEEESYLRELVTAAMDNNVLRVTVFFDDEENSREIMDYVCRSIEAKYSDLMEKTGLTSYTLAELDRNTDSMMMGANYAWYTNRFTEVENIVKNRNNFITNMKAENDIAEVITSVNKKKVLKKGILFGAVGGAAAWMIVLAFLVLSGRVLSAEELNRYYNLKSISILGSRRKGKPVSGITKKIYSLEKGGNGTLPDETRLELAENMIRQLCPGAKKIGLIGDVESEMMKEIRGGLAEGSQTEFIALDAAGSDVAQRKVLAETDGLILLAENEKTSYAATDDLLRLAANYNKKIIGSITC